MFVVMARNLIGDSYCYAYEAVMNKKGKKGFFY